MPIVMTRRNREVVSTPPTPPVTDPYFSNVVLLLHFNGVNNSTTFTDVKAKAMTAVGNAKISTAQSKFGGASGLFDGTGDRVTTPDSADWFFDTGKFTIELFVRHVTKNNNTTYVTQWTGGWAFYTETGQLKFRCNAPGILELVYTWAPTLNQWYHIAIDRDATGKTRLYVDGVMVASTTIQNGSIANTTSTLAIGAIGTSAIFPTYDFNGYMDELRITKGIARYATDTSFTVPTAAFPDS